MADDEVQIFEANFESSSDEEFNKNNVEPNELIETSEISVESAYNQLNALAQNSEPIEVKIARIKSEIDDLRVNDLEVADSLMSSLNASLKRQNSVPSEHQPLGPEKPTEVNEYEFKNLENRVNNLEKLVGPVSSQPITLKLENLRNILSLLLLNVDEVRNNAEIVAQETEKVQKIEYLYSKLREVDMAVRLVPQISARLQTLRDLHSKASNCVETNVNFNEEYKLMKLDLQNWRENLSLLEEKVQNFVSTSKQNVDSINKSVI